MADFWEAVGPAIVIVGSVCNLVVAVLMWRIAKRMGPPR